MNWINNTRNDGFTIIEILVVITIIVGILALTFPTISSYFKTSLNSATRDLAGISKETFHNSLLTGKITRIIYDINESKYWVESIPAGSTIDTEESLERQKKKQRVMKETKQVKFQMETNVTKRKVSLPTGVSFEDVITSRSEKPITEGQATTHFFPFGPGERVIIHLKDTSNHKASLVISPTTGNTTVYDRYIDAEEIFKH